MDERRERLTADALGWVAGLRGGAARQVEEMGGREKASVV